MNGESCEDFIGSVLQIGLERGKQRDYEWMADYAASRMSGPAARWLYSLPDEVSGDWRRLRSALLQRFPSALDVVESELAPALAARYVATIRIAR